MREQRSIDFMRAVLLAGGLAFIAILATDGHPMWRYGRVLIVAAVTALVTWQSGRVPSRVRGGVALVFGAGATVIGGGIAAIHLAKAGLTVASAMGLVLAVTGLLLLVVAVRLMLTGHRLIVQLGMAMAGFVALALVHWVTVPAVMATNVPQIDSTATTPADRGLDYEDVRFRTADDVTLAAWYVPADSGAAVILMHGAGSTRSTVLAEAAVLVKHGYAALLVDARGHGGSEGRAMEFGWYGERDIDAAVSYLVSRPDVDESRIGALGMSMGAEEAIGAAGGEPLIRAVVAEGATGRVAADKAWLSQEHGLAGWFTEQLEKVQYAITDLLTAAPKPASLRSAISRSDARFLVIAADKMIDEPTAASYLRSAAPDRVETWTVPDSGHTEGLATEPDEWEQRVVDFLSRTL